MPPLVLARLPLPLPLFQKVAPQQISFVSQMITRRIQVIQTSSCGRLFDAIASILDIRHQTTYEGQAAVELEAAATHDTRTYSFDVIGAEPFRIDLRDTIRSITRDFLGGTPVAVISARFHRTLARVVVDSCLRIRQSTGLTRVCLSGGTFQNLRLLEHSLEELREAGFEVFIHQRVPPNDGGLVLGQAVIANHRITA